MVVSCLHRVISTVDPEAACDLAREAQVILQENAVQLPTLGQAMFYVLEDNIQNFELGAQGNWWYIYNTVVE